MSRFGPERWHVQDTTRGLPVHDAARLQSLADLIAWQAENLRRRATVIRATNQMYALPRRQGRGL